jgi:hypothetical protein
MLYSNIVNLLLYYFKNTYWFKKHFLHTKYIFLCIIASKNPVYKDLLTTTHNFTKLFCFQAL